MFIKMENPDFKTQNSWSKDKEKLVNGDFSSILENPDSEGKIYS